jgi:hypothetical protein
VVYGTDHHVWRRTALFLRRFFRRDGFADEARMMTRKKVLKDVKMGRLRKKAAGKARES